jgi:hypothetical protein
MGLFHILMNCMAYSDKPHSFRPEVRCAHARARVCFPRQINKSTWHQTVVYFVVFKRQKSVDMM